MSYQNDSGIVEEEFYKGYRIRLMPEESIDESPRSWGSNFGTMVCWHNRYTLGDKHDYRDMADFLLNQWNDMYHDILIKGGYGAFHAITKQLQEELAAERAEGEVIDWAEFEHRLDRGDDSAVAEMWERWCRTVLVLPLNLYEHSGITMSTSRGYPFCDPWDSGQVGWIYVTLDDVRKEFGKQRLSKKTIERAYEIMRQEVKTYDQYLTGDVYFFEISEWTGEEPYDEDEHEYDDEDELWHGVDGMGGLYGSTYAMEEARRMVDYLVEEKAKEAA